MGDCVRLANKKNQNHKIKIKTHGKSKLLSHNRTGFRSETRITDPHHDLIVFFAKYYTPSRPWPHAGQDRPCRPRCADVVLFLT